MLEKLHSLGKIPSLVIFAIVYAMTFIFTCWLYSNFLADMTPVASVAIAMLCSTLFVYIFSVLFRNSGTYDGYWSLAPIVVAIFYYEHAVSTDNSHARQMLVLFLVALWGVRLTYNWCRQWGGIGHEDWRYIDQREQFGSKATLIHLFSIHLMPGTLVYLGCLCIYASVSKPGADLNFLDIFAVLWTFFAIWIEAAADRQMHDFLKVRKPGEVMTLGLWSWSRHPNYFGEVAFWWGLYFFAIAADTANWWMIIGPILITCLFLFLSIPVIDQRSLERRPEFEAYMKRTNAFIPWFPKKG